MVASGSRTTIAGFLSSCIAGFRQSCSFSQSSGLRRRAAWPAFTAWRAEVAPIGRATADRHGPCVLIRRMSIENPLWGAPRIHGELLKLGFEVAQSSVAAGYGQTAGRLSQGWRPSWHNHAPDIAAMDPFVVLTIGFDLLYAFVIVRLDRRDLYFNYRNTANPTG